MTARPATSPARTGDAAKTAFPAAPSTTATVIVRTIPMRSASFGARITPGIEKPSKTVPDSRPTVASEMSNSLPS